MLSNDQLKEQLKFVLTSTNFPNLGERYQGKVRDCYTKGNTRVLVTSDRFSCFDVVLTAVPFKGQALNQMAISWFELTSDIARNHIIDVPDPNVMVVKQCQMLPVEVVIRAYLAGSGWRDYQAGKDLSGVKLPPGLKFASQFESPIVTPATKAEAGSHDLPISEAEIIKQNLVTEKIWSEAKETALALFKLGSERAKMQGLILVDTKYEFGLVDGKLTLADEIHTMDCSRYWVAASYPERFKSGENPEMLDKEPTRQWLLKQGYKGEGVAPEFTDEHRIELSRHYVSAFERITGLEFKAEVGDPLARISRNLKKLM